jgi:hypothetical protein
MSDAQQNWKKSSESATEIVYTKSERGHEGVITINKDASLRTEDPETGEWSGLQVGAATLVIDGGSPEVFDTFAQAKNAFRKELFGG